jgi:NADPH:quinone reductase-like Zn-dependent oxidoreductase/acyl carrier protein
VRCPHEIAPAEFYGRLRENGLEYGPCFRGVEQVWRGDEEALGRLRIPPSLESQVDAYRLHPALLDAALQVLAAALLDGPADSRTGGLYLPVRVAEVRVYSRPPLQVWSHARLRASEERGAIIEGDLRLCDEAGHVIAEVVGLRLQRVDEDLPSAVPDEWEDWLYTLRWEPWATPPAGSAPSPPPAGQRSSWLILADRGGVGQALQARLEACGQVCSVVQPGPAYEALPDPHHYRVNPASLEDFRHLFERTCGLERPPCAGILYLWSLDAPPPEGMTLAALESAQQAGCLGVLHLLQALSEVQQAGSPRLWLVTRGVQCGPSLSAPPALAQSPMWGLARVIAHEHPELRCTAVDLSAATPPQEIESLFQLLWLEEGEDQIALRGTERYVARLARFAPEPQRVWPVSGQAASPQAPSDGEGVRAVPGQTPFRLETSEPGLLDNLALRATTRQRPGPGEVEIQVRTAGLNFLDVLTALGLRPDLPEGPVQFGVECAGTIAALGEGVEEFQVGDEVIAIAPACFGSFAVTSAAIVVPKPAHLSFEEAATIPVAFLTSFYALHHLGRLAQGERVLIHAASGGVGLAAVQLAQRAGAEVFATAGSPDKREFLHSLGVEHVFDSRSLAFADEIMERTNRQGVDVVLNSLAGEAVPRSISTLRAYGRFLEIGKRDIYQDRQLGLRPFQNNLSFFAIDINRLLRERPAFARSLWDEVMQQFEDGSLRPLPLRVFPISQAVSAFRHMQQAKHIGKVVVSLEDREVIVEPPSGKPPLFRAEDTYLITGGLGGLGLAVAQWMVSQGARHLVLAGRSGATVAAQEAIRGMEQGGAQVKVVRADVTQEEQVAEMLAEIAHSTPPLRGIVHAAGILDDGILLQLDAERFRAVLAPKVSGAWNLHAHTLDLPLDLFVLFSSAASLLGPPGQGNYAAANAFLDALAHYRCAQGRPAISINWGPWASVGLAVRPERGGRLARRGFGSIAPAQGLQVLEQLLSQSAPQVAVMPVNWQRLRQLDPSAAQSALLAHLVYEQAGISPEVEAPQKGSAIRDALLAAEPGERQRLMESYLSAQVSRVIGVPVDRLDVLQSFTNLGIDSMMAVELKNRLRTDLGIEFPIVELFRHTTIRSLAKYLSGLQEGEEAPAREQSQTRAEAIRESRERQRALRQQQRAARE